MQLRKARLNNYYSDKNLIFPIKEGPHLPPTELRQTLKTPHFMKSALEEIGFSKSDEISLGQLQKICHDLKQERVLEKIMPMLKEVMDTNGRINVQRLESFLSASADLELERVMPSNERLESLFSYISRGKTALTAHDMCDELMAKEGDFDMGILRKYAEISDEKLTLPVLKKYLREYQFSQTHK